MTLRQAILEKFLLCLSFKHVINKPTCYKSPINPKGVDLMLTNRRRSFQISCAIDTGLSDFHKVTVTELRCLLLILKTSGKTSADE